MVLKNLLLSEAIGDIAGSVYEFHPERDINKINLMSAHSTYTDDTVCTFAVAEALMHKEDVQKVLLNRCSADPERGYGEGFRTWLQDPSPKPYNSFGNGSAMRCSAAGFMAQNEKECIRLATLSAECTHNHPEGIKGAVATALAIYYLMQGKNKAFVRKHILNKYYPNFKDWSIDEIKQDYGFDETCQGTVPVCLIAFLESRSYTDCLKLNISMSGDADTMGAIAGPMAYAYYRQMPQELITAAKEKLPAWMLEINDEMDEFVASKNGVKEKVKQWNRCIIYENMEKEQTEKPKFTPFKIDYLKKNEIFVFGSNLAGAHAGGAAKAAMNKFGAIWGQGVGLQGQSYAIPTMQGGIETIKPYVDEFLAFAKSHKELTFLVTRIGCGIAGFKDEEIAPLFKEALDIENILLPKSFAEVLKK